MKKILIVDNEKSFLAALQVKFRAYRDKIILLTAENGDDAIDILQEMSVDLIVIDLEMSQMNGFGILALVNRSYPQLPVIVTMTNFTSEVESQLGQYKILQYQIKPIHLDMLESTILAEVGSGTKSYLRGIAPGTFLQLLQLEKKSCSVKIKSANRTGYLFLHHGNIVDAEYENLSGETAAYEIVCWEKSDIEMDDSCQRHGGPINASLESILLNAHSRKDEQEEETPQENEVRPQDLSRPGQKDLAEPAENGELISQKALSEQVKELILKRVTSLREISEFILFDQNCLPERQNPGKCSLRSFDPAIYLYLVDPLGKKLGLGACNGVIFYNARRTPFLLFKVASYSLLVKLKQGALSQRIVQELGKTIKNTLEIG